MKVSNFIENKLKLKVNNEKSQVCSCDQTKFLGYIIQRDGGLTIVGKSLERMKEKICKIPSATEGGVLSESYRNSRLFYKAGYSIFNMPAVKNCYKTLMRGDDGNSAVTVSNNVNAR